MSLEVLLIPLAIAAWSASREVIDRKRETSDVFRLTHPTRIKSLPLLMEVLQSRPGSLESDGDTVTQANDLGEFLWNRQPDGTWAVSISSDGDVEPLMEYVSDVYPRYGKLVQAEVARRIEARAEALGLRIDSRATADDDSINYVINVSA